MANKRKSTKSDRSKVFKEIQAVAKKLRQKNKSLTQQEAVSRAWKQRK